MRFAVAGACLAMASVATAGIPDSWDGRPIATGQLLSVRIEGSAVVTENSSQNGAPEFIGYTPWLPVGTRYDFSYVLWMDDSALYPDWWYEGDNLVIGYSDGWHWADSDLGGVDWNNTDLLMQRGKFASILMSAGSWDVACIWDTLDISIRGLSVAATGNIDSDCAEYLEIDPDYPAVYPTSFNYTLRTSGKIERLFVNDEPMQLSAYFNTVPEPAAWALLLAGFGVIGVAARRQRAATARA